MSEDKHSVLASIKKRRGMVRALITCLERCISAFEIKDQLAHADCLVIQHLVKKFEALDTKFRQHHYTIVELLDDKALDEKQAALEDHNGRVTDLIKRL